MLLTLHKIILINIFCGNILQSELSSGCSSLDRKNKTFSKMSGEFVLWVIVQSLQELKHSRSSHDANLPTSEIDCSESWYRLSLINGSWLSCDLLLRVYI